MSRFGFKKGAFGCLRNLCSKGGKGWGWELGAKKINPLPAGCLISSPSPEFANLLRPCPQAPSTSHHHQSPAYQAQQASLILLPALTMARKAAAADPDSGTTNVNIADFQRTRDSVRPALEVSSVFPSCCLRVKNHTSWLCTM
jgi:hypothetical protein